MSRPSELRDRILAERRGTPFLVYRDEDGQQLILELDESRSRVTIGRRVSSDVALSWDSEVSRLHAELERVGSTWVVCDEDLSHNGTLVNGERVRGRRRLRDGDVVAIGDSLIAFRHPGDAVTTTTAPTRTAQRPSPEVALSAAQRRVLFALCKPYGESLYAAPASNQQIADELVVTVNTVKGTLRQTFPVARPMCA